MAVALAECLEAMTREGADADTVAVRQPEAAQEIRSLLQTVQTLKAALSSPCSPSPEFVAALKNRLLEG